MSLLIRFDKEMLPVTCPSIFIPEYFGGISTKNSKLMIALAENEKALLWLAAYRADCILCKRHWSAVRRRRAG